MPGFGEPLLRVLVRRSQVLFLFLFCLFNRVLWCHWNLLYKFAPGSSKKPPFEVKQKSKNKTLSLARQRRKVSPAEYDVSLSTEPSRGEKLLWTWCLSK